MVLVYKYLLSYGISTVDGIVSFFRGFHYLVLSTNYSVINVQFTVKAQFTGDVKI